MPKSLLAILAMMLIGGTLRGQTVPASSTASAPSAKTISVPATLDAYESADLYAKDAGYLSEVKADLGDHVKQGQVLAVIEDPELVKQVDMAKATLAARQEMAKASEAAVAQSQKTQDVVRSQLTGYRADLALAQATLNRQEELFESKAITAQQVDEVRAKAQVAAAQADVAQARVGASEADVAAAQANLSVARSQVTVADAELGRLQALLDYTKIVAPFDGVITRRWVSRGDLIQSGAGNRATPLFTCQRVDIIRVFCDVPETNAAAIAPGAATSIKIFGLDNQVIVGKVTRIAAALNPSTRTMRVEIDLPNPDEKLRPGMYAQVTLTLPTKP